MKKIHNSIVIVSVVTLWLFGSGCAGLKPAVYSSPDFKPMEIVSLTLLPPLDGRLDRSSKVDLQKAINKRVEGKLKDRKYIVVIAPASTSLSESTPGQLASPSPDWVRSLPPAESRWIMLIRLDDVSSKITFGSTGSAEISGYLFDKQNAKMLWHDKAIGRAGQGGLLGMALIGLMEDAAIEEAVNSLMSSLPKREPSK
jgi:hypothetical protein